MKKRYIKENKKLFHFMHNEKYEIIDIKIVRKFKGIRKIPFISSYCVIYKNKV